MIFAFTAWIILIFYKAKRMFPRFNHEFLNHDMTNSINGIFILLVFMSHFNPYVRYTVMVCKADQQSGTVDGNYFSLLFRLWNYGIHQIERRRIY